MSYAPSPSDLHDWLHAHAADYGACAVGVARLDGPVDDGGVYDRWLSEGRHATMAYMERHNDLRRNPRLLLDGARSIVCCAFPYGGGERPRRVNIAQYALGDDYHDVLRRRLKALAAALVAKYRGSVSSPLSTLHSPLTRICVDTAPVRERYWARRAGLGVIGLNGLLIVPGVGSRVFLGEIIATLDIAPDKPLEGDCGRCRACLEACPGRAIASDGVHDSRLCLSYLTIEHRGAFSPGTDLHGRLYGCDACLDACPHNAGRRPDALPEFQARQQLLNLTPEDVLGLTEEGFLDLTRHSAMRRATCEGLRRNAQAVYGSVPTI